MKPESQPIYDKADRQPTLTEAERAAKRRDDFRKDMENVINRHSMENGSNTPDFILANYLMSCLDAFDFATKERTQHGGGSREDHNA